MKTATGYIVKPLIVEHALATSDALLDIHHDRISMAVGGLTADNLRELACELIKAAAQIDNARVDDSRLQMIWELAA